MIPQNLKIMNSLLLNYKKACTIVMLFCGTVACAQVPPKTQPQQAPSSVRRADKTFDVREKLVQLAMQNPTYEIADRRVSIASYQVKKAKGSWLSIITVQGNLNEFAFKGAQTVNGITTNPSTYYPKYNIGASIPFDIFSSKKNDTKIAKENYGIAQAEKNQRFREIKALVLTKYEDYLLSQQKLEFQSQITQDARTSYLASEKDFQEGAIKQDDYNKSYRSYTDEKIRQAEYLRNYNVIKLELESMIGISMDELLK